MDMAKEIHAVMAAKLGRLETEAITQSLCKALGVEDCNPYEYLNRMSAQHRGGVRYVLLDGRDLMRIHPVKTEYHHEEMQCTLHHEYLWTDVKKPTV